MYCSNCGKQVGEAGSFCRECGAHQKPGLVQAVVVPQAGSQSQQTIRNPYAGKNKQIVGGLILVVGILVTIGSCASLQEGDSGWAMLIGALIYDNWADNHYCGKI
jgi:uncharacterized membrane protein YvbJ